MQIEEERQREVKRRREQERQQRLDEQRAKQEHQNKYIQQFAKKYGDQFNREDLINLQKLLNNEIPFNDLENSVSNEIEKRKIEAIKNKLLGEKPFKFYQCARNFLNLYQINDEKMLKILEEVLREKNLYSESHIYLKLALNKIEDEIKAENFKRRLFEENHTTLKDIDNFSGYEFERFLKQLFEKMGYEVEQTRLSGDQGADLVVVKFGEKTVIQAKRFAGKVGNKAVQEIMAAISLYKADKGMVVTNSYFTPAAVELGRANKIELIDRDQLKKWIESYW